MNEACELSFQQRSLFQQGYQRFSPAELRQLEWGLRFTPTVCSLITLTGLVLQQAYVLLAVAVLGMWAFFFPAAHPMDLLYNHVVRRAFGAVALPENPLQRRLACLSAGVMNLAAGLLVMGGMGTAAWVVGGMLLCLQAIVITTHFCALSWIYEGVMRALGRWKLPLPADQVKRLLAKGARLVDVRSPNEFAAGSIRGAVNLPLEELDGHLAELARGPALLFCRSGMRSQIATEKARAQGCTEVYNLGPMRRAQEIVDAE
jgi:phage shock protein E